MERLRAANQAERPRLSGALGILTVLFAALSWLVMPASPASAHAAFVTSSPEPGADLATAPGVVTLRFSEPLIDDLSSATVTDPAGRTFSGGPTGDREIQVDVNSTAQGEYTVEWKIVSPIDGHTLRGRFTFGVGASVGQQDRPSDLPSATDLLVGAARTLEYAGLLGALGVLTLAALAGSVELTWVPRGLHRWIIAGAVGGLLTVSGELVLATSGTWGSAAGTFLLAPSGVPRLARVGTEVVAVVLTATAVRRAGDGVVRSRGARVWTTLLILASLALVAAAGHAAAAGTYGVLADAGHLWTAGVWAGSLLVMAVQRPPGGWRGETGRTLIREFSPIALTTFVATVLLGTVRGWQELAPFRPVGSRLRAGPGPQGPGRRRHGAPLGAGLASRARPSAHRGSPRGGGHPRRRGPGGVPRAPRADR